MSTSKTGEGAGPSSSSQAIKRNEYPDTVERPVKSVSVPPTGVFFGEVDLTIPTFDLLRSFFEVCSVPLPSKQRLDINDIFDPQTGEIQLEVLRTHFIKEGRLTERCANKLVNDGTEILRAEPTMVDIEAPITVCGDIWGWVGYFSWIKMVKTSNW